MDSILKGIWRSVFNLTGLDISFGARYKDWSFYSIEFKADYQRVKQVLSEKRFSPVEIAPGETRLQIIGCEMKDVQIAGSYHEVSIQVPVDALDDSPGEKFAHLYLPVTKETARWSGVDIFGLPKFIAGIQIEKVENQIVCRLTADEKLVLEFRTDDKVGIKRQYRWEYYGIRKQQIIKTTFDLEGLIFEGGTSRNAGLTLGEHQISETLRQLIRPDEIVRTVIGHNVSGILRKPVRIEA